MLWRLALILTATFGNAAIVPEKFGPWTRTEPSTPAPVPDQQVWAEYGLIGAESATYSAGSRKLKLTVHQMKDSTGGLAAWQALRPEGSTASKLGPVAATTPQGSLLLIGNYVALFSVAPAPADVAQLRNALAKVDRVSLPNLPGYLPRKDRVAASERYVLGPESLARVMPEVPAPVARFDLGAEAQFARYRTAGVDDRLLIISYPTPQIARLQAEALGRLPGISTHRAGPMVAVAPTREGVGALLQAVSYNPSLMWNEQPPKPQGNPGDMLLAIVTLAGVLILASVLFGLAFGGFRLVGSRFGMQPADQSLTTLHLSDR